MSRVAQQCGLGCSLSTAQQPAPGAPVMANALEKPLTVSVRSRMPGRAAKLWCCAGAYTMCS